MTRNVGINFELDANVFKNELKLLGISIHAALERTDVKEKEQMSGGNPKHQLQTTPFCPGGTT